MFNTETDDAIGLYTSLPTNSRSEKKSSSSSINDSERLQGLLQLLLKNEDEAQESPCLPCKVHGTLCECENKQDAPLRSLTHAPGESSMKRARGSREEGSHELHGYGDTAQYFRRTLLNLPSQTYNHEFQVFFLLILLLFSQFHFLM